MSLLANRLSAELYISEFRNKDVVQQLLAAIENFEADLVVIASSQFFGLQTQELIHQSPVPVLLLPDQREWAWDSVLVPMSGEIKQNSALEVAVSMANQLNIPVDVIHVAPSSVEAAQQCASCVVESYTDHPHHEYPGRIEEFLAEAAPFTSTRERAKIREVRLIAGDPAHEILVHSRMRDSSLIILEWHGSIKKGRAATLRHLLRQPLFPVLLIRPATQQYQMKVTLIAA